MVEFKQIASLEPYIDIIRELRKTAKMNFEKYFFMLMNIFVFRKYKKKT